MKPLRIVIRANLRRHVRRLLKEGLSGSTERQVVIRMIEDSIRNQLRSYAWRR